jgi:adenylate cyclase class 2
MMETQDQEIEVKFYVKNLEHIEARLLELGAQVTQARTHEINLRFDTPEYEFKHQFRVLRLRQDTHARLTYKGPGVYEDGVRTRQEIEFVVSDFSAARRLLEALGYLVAMVYEKYRTVYDFSGLHIALDELPYGRFVEIEGPDIPALQALNLQLGLDWQAAVTESYAALFDRLCVRLNLPFRDLVFDNFQALTIRAADLGVRRAD